MSFLTLLVSTPSGITSPPCYHTGSGDATRTLLLARQAPYQLTHPNPRPKKNGFGYKIKLKRNHGNKKSIQFHKSKTRPLIFMDSLSVLFRHEVTDYLMDNICDCINLSINHSFHGVNICADYRNPW